MVQGHPLGPDDLKTSKKEPTNINSMAEQNHYTVESFATNSLSPVDKYTKCYEKKNKWK